MLLLDFIPAIRALVEKKGEAHSREELASGFHNTLCHSFAAMARKISEQTGLNRVVLSGGCFQNRKLLEGCIAAMGRAGFEVFTHHLVPTNDPRRDDDPVLAWASGVARTRSAHTRRVRHGR